MIYSRGKITGDLWLLKFEGSGRLARGERVARRERRDAREKAKIAIAVHDGELVADRAGGDQAVDSRPDRQPRSAGSAIERHRIFEYQLAKG